MERLSMKLILENWNNFLNEQAEGGGIELYHATCAPPEAFAKGIDVGLAKGYGQGEGFYLFPDKNRALRHAKNLISASISKQVKQDCSKGAYIVIVDEPVTPENFDIDYEVYASGFLSFMLKNLDFFKQNADKLQFSQKSFANLDNPNDARFMYTIPGRTTRVTFKIHKMVAPGADPENIRIQHGTALGYIARDLASLFPEMFRKFEEEFLSKASAIKYNGEKKIFPLRIEDLEGKTVWSRK